MTSTHTGSSYQVAQTGHSLVKDRRFECFLRIHTLREEPRATYRALDLILGELVGVDVRILSLDSSFSLAKLHHDILVLIHEPD